MKNNRSIVWRGVMVLCCLFFFNPLYGQWYLVDTTIQAARDVDFPDPTAAYLTSDMGVLYKSVDGGVTWFNQYDFGVFSSLRTPCFMNKDTGFVAANQGIQRTFDGGQSWTNIAFGNFFTPSSFSVTNNLIVMSYHDFNNDTTYVKKSTDFGTSFVSIMTHYNPGFNAFSVSFIDAQNGYVINPNALEEVYKTTNGGISFDTLHITTGPIHLEEKFQFSDIENGYIFGGWGAQSNPSRTWNTGTFYFPIDLDGFGILPVFDLEFIGANKTYASSLYGKIFLSLNNGQFWTEQNTPVSHEVTSVAFTDELNGIAVSRGEIIYTKNGGTLSINDDVPNTTITVYPNPAKKNLFIETNDREIIELSIFSINGQLIRRFNQDVKSINLDHMAAGVYVLKIKTETSVISKKIEIEQ